MPGDVAVQNAAAMVADDKKAVEHGEGNRGNGEEIHRGSGLPVITKKGEPALSRVRVSGARFIQREIVLSETSKPSMRSSPWTGGAPQLGLSATIRKMRSRTSFNVCLLPMGFLTWEIILQYQRNPVRCQRITVSGVTTMRACFHPNQFL